MYAVIQCRIESNFRSIANNTVMSVAMFKSTFSFFPMYKCILQILLYVQLLLTIVTTSAYARLKHILILLLFEKQRLLRFQRGLCFFIK